MLKRMVLYIVLGLIPFTALSGKALAGSEPYIGDVIWVPFDYAPEGWLPCNGQVLQISQYQILYAVIGIQFGGDGTTTFKLPDMRGRTIIHASQQSGGQSYAVGNSGGSEMVTLNANQMPSHAHNLVASNSSATATTPGNNMAYAKGDSAKTYGNGSSATMSASAVSAAGGNQPHNNMMPYTTLNCIIAIEGNFPPRD